MSTFKILSYFSGFSALIPIIIGLIRIKRIQPYAVWGFIWVVFSLLVDITSFITVESGRSSLPYVHQFFLWQVPIVWLIFEKSLPINRKIIWGVRLITLLSVLIMIIFLWDHWFYAEMIIPVVLVSTLSIILISILFIFDWVTYSDINQIKDANPLFLFGIILIYECSIVPVFAAHESYLIDLYRVKLIV